jgi:thioesterase domain-containing protein
VYGLQAPPLSDPTATPPRTVGELAGVYLERIRTVQPEGPYALLGYSFGGILAVELATRLRAAGQDVALTAVLDYLPAAAPEPDAQLRDADAIDQETLRLLLEFLAPTTPQPPGRLAPEEVFARLTAPGGAFDGLPTERLATLLPTRAHHIRLARGWRPPRYDGRILLVSAGDEPGVPSTAEKAARWRRTVRTVDVLELPCIHNDLLTPRFAARIAAAVEAELTAHTAPQGRRAAAQRPAPGGRS